MQPLTKEALNAWKDFLTDLKTRLDKIGLISLQTIEEIKNKTVSEAFEILSAERYKTALRLDEQLLEKLKNVTYLTFCEHNEDGKYTKTKDAYFIKPSFNDLGFVTNQFSKWYSSEFSPKSILFQNVEGIYGGLSFDDYSDLREDVDFFIDIDGTLYYVDAKSIKKLVDRIDEETKQSNEYEHKWSLNKSIEKYEALSKLRGYTNFEYKEEEPRRKEAKTLNDIYNEVFNTNNKKLTK